MTASVARSPKAVEQCCEPREAAILVAESDSSIGGELVEQLRADRYHAMFAHTAQHARALARAQPVRAVVLGVLDTPRGALELLEEVRCSCGESPVEAVWDEHLPAIVLGSSGGQLDLLRAFEMGADDFIAQPVSYLELRARLKAVLRRVERSPAVRMLQVGSLEIDTAAHLVRVGGAPVGLCRLEYELLVCLARNPTSVCSKQELMNTIWGRTAGTGTRTVDSHASRLRRKLDSAGAHGLVVNVWGIGYRLI